MSAEQRQQTRSGGNAPGQPGSRPRPALDPSVPVLVQPYKGLVEQGIIDSITVVFSSLGTQVSGKASQRLADVKDSGLNTTDSFPVARLMSIAEAGELFTRPGKGKKTGSSGPAIQKPSKSLVPEDLDGSLNAAALQQRINEIARSCGGGPLVGRVRSEGRFEGTATTSYRDWWEAANSSDRALSLSEGKRRALLTDEMKARLNGLQCPFRGTLEFVVSNADEDEDE